MALGDMLSFLIDAFTDSGETSIVLPALKRRGAPGHRISPATCDEAAYIPTEAGADYKKPSRQR
jgi:hypothetical protein